jgi:hypothetical protein
VSEILLDGSMKFRFFQGNTGTDEWNTIGRAVISNDTSEIERFHEGLTDDPNLVEDTRSSELAEAVLAKIVELNETGRSREARALFDPAHAPFIPAMEKGGRGLGFCVILGKDEFLVNQGTYWTPQTTWHIRGQEITAVDTLCGFCWSRNRQHLLAVGLDGTIALQRRYGETPHDIIAPLPQTAFIPTGLPENLATRYAIAGDRAHYTHLGISNDGNSILLADADRGVVLLRRSGSAWSTSLLYPSVICDLAQQMQDDDGEDAFEPYLQMLHAALSPDGRWVALGTQDQGHIILDVEHAAQPRLHAKLGHLSEYPHDACFSDDSNFVSLNSCHFYNGVTFSAHIPSIAGLDMPPYEQTAAQTIINSYLRVYASAYLPATMTGVGTGAFLLAGATYASCVTPGGKLLWEVGFGSSAGGVDACPETGRVLIASHSGMLHLLDATEKQMVPILAGHKPRLELRRWIFWDRLARPIEW